MHKLSSTSDTPVSETREQEPKVSSLQPTQRDSSQHRKKKSKKHKDKEREKFKDDHRTDWLKTNNELEKNPDKLDSKAFFSPVY